ncbi:uncharacterized protein LOC121388332 [Gigantopelta aegis]|uniref:uncharacterized protein LOC121388332 n=1 Tax=Gigantopelta aegis TaxID=1735272 RepID=UPI001B88B07B|nr:uncharacterized protein LOC121388332 [Gigantopelta aegis]
MFSVSCVVFVFTVLSFGSDRPVSAAETCTNNDVSTCTNVCAPHQQLSCHGGFCGCEHSVGVAGTCAVNNITACEGTCTHFNDEVMICNAGDECRCFHQTNVIGAPQAGSCEGMNVTQCAACALTIDARVCHNRQCHCTHIMGGTCNAGDVSSCTAAQCEAGSSIVCHLTSCYCDHIMV